VAHGSITLEWDSFSAVALGYSLSSPQLHVVMNHQFRNMKLLVHRLNHLGYKRIGLVMPANTDERVDHNYLAGYWIARRELQLEKVGIAPLLNPVIERAALVKWVKRSRPDVLITSAGTITQFIEWLNAEGYDVPGDLGLAVASVPFGQQKISGIDENVRAVGAMAVDTVVGMIHRRERGVPPVPWRILAEGNWFPGRTVRDQRSSRKSKKLLRRQSA
jgi:LacI family transcriptional regulator